MDTRPTALTPWPGVSLHIYTEEGRCLCDLRIPRHPQAEAEVADAFIRRGIHVDTSDGVRFELGTDGAQIGRRFQRLTAALDDYVRTARHAYDGSSAIIGLTGLGMAAYLRR